MGRCVLGALLLLACACSPSVTAQSDAPPAQTDAPPGPDPNDGARSGTRLKLTWFELGDGTRQWDGFYDAQRKENCYIYQDWTDGKSYCAPDYDGSIEYSNAGCTAKVIEVYKSPSCPSPPQPYAMEYSYTPCDSKPARLWVRGNKVALGQYWYKGSDGICNGPYTTSIDYDYYALGPEVAKTDLVEVTLGSPVGPGRLATRYYQSADGMQLQGTVHDAALGEDCYPQTYGGGTSGMCAPSARYVSYAENATCTAPKLALPATCTAPKYTVYYPTNACPDTPPNYYTLGALTTGAPLYYDNGSSCSVQTPPTNNTFYKMGNALNLAPVTSEIGTAGQRIQLVHYKDAEGLNYRSYELFDALKGASCYPTKLPDGTIRCVVYGGYTRTLYKDTGCTQTIELVEVSKGGGSCATPAAPKYARKYITPPAGSCQYGTQVYAVGAAYTGPLYELSGTCIAYSRATRTVYSLGAQVPLNDFISASISIDP